MSPDRLRRALIALGLACLAAGIAMAALFDAGVAHWLEPRVPLRVDLVAWQRAIDFVVLKRISAVSGAVLFLWGYWGWRSGWLATRFVMGWGGLIAASEYSVDLIKWIAGRERPVHWLAQGDDASDWLVGGNYSFPSGHAAYYWALVLPVAIRWPRIGVPLLALSLYVAEQRVLVLAHHWGDVLASIGIAMLWAAALLPWLTDRAPSARAAAGGLPRSARATPSAAASSAPG
ncbi:MAG: phosphatase PAP2 family protein [Sphingomonadales bacterium]|nr:phosphatase PAP2 family protein [Sphingomonadales bacterium]